MHRRTRFGAASESDVVLGVEFVGGPVARRARRTRAEAPGT